VDEKVKSINKLGWVFRVWTKMHKVELAERYIEEVKAEDAVPKQGGAHLNLRMLWEASSGYEASHFTIWQL
jgi:hypothetical protein